MIETREFLKSILDAIAESVVVIDQEGDILYVNRSWNNFGTNNACLIDDNWQSVNYLRECDKAATMGDEYGVKAADGINKVITQELKVFYLEYPCHSPDENRWFMMRVTPFPLGDVRCFVISHQNITERKLAEEAVSSLANIDGLTGIPNRRNFDEFLENEWRRCARLGLPIALAIIDLDYFKMINDTYGHPAGDACLKNMAKLASKICSRPTDQCARFGGDEFAIVYGNTDMKDAQRLIQKLISAVAAAQIPNQESPVAPVLTLSIGLTVAFPDKDASQEGFLPVVDRLMYAAKKGGRNQLVCLAE